MLSYRPPYVSGTFSSNDSAHTASKDVGTVGAELDIGVPTTVRGVAMGPWFGTDVGTGNKPVARTERDYTHVARLGVAASHTRLSTCSHTETGGYNVTMLTESTEDAPRIVDIEW